MVSDDHSDQRQNSEKKHGRYKEDWSLEFGEPVKKITIEDLIEEDKRAAGEEEEERRRELEEEEALQKILESMTVEQRVGYLAARQKF